MDDLSDEQETGRSNAVLAIYLGLIVVTQLAVIIQADIGSLLSPSGQTEKTVTVKSSASLAIDTKVDGAPSDDDAPIEAKGEADLPEILGEPTKNAMAESSGPKQSNAAIDEPAKPGFSSIQFDLRSVGGGETSQPKSASDLVEIRKPLYSGSNALGSLTIAVDGNAQVFVKKSALSGLLASDASISPKLARLPDGDLISFRRLRDYGINLKYEPVSDQIRLEAP